MKKQTRETQLFRSPLVFTASCALTALFLALSSGCGSAYRATSKPFIGYSSFAPVIQIHATTNLAHEGRSRPAPSTRADTLDAQATIHAPVIICAEQLYLSIFGGTAASNSVLSEIQVPLTGAP